ncbi:BACON domain-containing protein [Bacteroides reticulotermitis]|uniref:BACON domain-containing protein n=1 Tax=Bacteroides reticulotermitis TaxID=1133319 RepID=UPI003A877744
MKKLYSLFIALAGILCFTSCGDDYAYTAPEALDVTKADLYFKAPGGTGSIEVKTDRELQATSSVDWCSVSVSGGVVTAKVVKNESIESRAGTITLNDGVLTSLVAVYQEGFAFGIDASNLKTLNANAADSTSVIVTSSSPYIVNIPSYAASWLSYTADEDGKVTFHFTKNESGAPRGANVTISCDDREKSFTIRQYDINSFVGAWKVSYADGEDLYEEDITITSPTTGALYLNFAPLTPTVTPIFHCTYVNGGLKMANGNAQGRYSSYYLFTLFSSTDGYISWAATYTYSASPYIAEDGTFYMVFANDGSWPNKETNGVALGAFTSATATNAGFVGTLATYTDLVLYK